MLCIWVGGVWIIECVVGECVVGGCWWIEVICGDVYVVSGGDGVELCC